MASANSERSVRSINQRLSANPESLTHHELYDIKLSQLSKMLGTQLSSRSTIGTYLRWLEVQRTGAEHNQNKNSVWETLRKQWVASLKIKGFTEGDISREVGRWNDQMRNEQRRLPYARSPLTEAMVHDVFQSGFPFQPRRTEDMQSSFGTSNTHKRSASSLDRGVDYEETNRDNESNKRTKLSSFAGNQSHGANEPSFAPINFTCKRCHFKGKNFQDLP